MGRWLGSSLSVYSCKTVKQALLGFLCQWLTKSNHYHMSTMPPVSSDVQCYHIPCHNESYFLRVSSVHHGEVEMHKGLKEICKRHKFQWKLYFRNYIYFNTSQYHARITANLSLYIINYSPCHEDVWGTRGTAPPFLIPARDGEVSG
jgi:hypothetical protein